MPFRCRAPQPLAPRLVTARATSSARMRLLPIANIFALCLASCVVVPRAPARAGRPPATASPRFLMAHYMPWFEAAPNGQSFGWHWTMNHYHPERSNGGRPEAASHYFPLLGLYDSTDPDTLECHVLLMKLAGIDGGYSWCSATAITRASSGTASSLRWRRSRFSLPKRTVARRPQAPSIGPSLREARRRRCAIWKHSTGAPASGACSSPLPSLAFTTSTKRPASTSR